MLALHQVLTGADSYTSQSFNHIAQMTAPLIEFDREMINRYNHSGPRYTSYPTAVTFHEGYKIEDYDAACRDGNNDPVPAPLSLYFHVPFCDTVCFYCGCNKIVTKHKSRAKPYLEMLDREIEIVGAKFADDREVEQLHLGGGTPTFLSEAEISHLMWKVQSHFNARPSERKDYSIEIDPRSVTPHYIQVLGTLGFNRYSLGVQDVDIKVQTAVNRVQSVKMTRQIMDACRDAGAKSINIDLIYGLPFQTPESFKETVDVVISMNPERLSIFNYAHLPERFKPQRRINCRLFVIADIRTCVVHGAFLVLFAHGITLYLLLRPGRRGIYFPRLAGHSS